MFVGLARVLFIFIFFLIKLNCSLYSIIYKLIILYIRVKKSIRNLDYLQNFHNILINN